MSRRRVVVTGLGIVSPLGSTVATAWEGIVNGRSGIGHIDKMDLSAFPVRIGGQAQGFNAEAHRPPADHSTRTPNCVRVLVKTEVLSPIFYGCSVCLPKFRHPFVMEV